MSETEHFDVVILGSGQGGKLLAWHLGHSGKKVAVVERRWVGGSCPAVACLPSKNELWSGRVAHLVQNAARFGTLAIAVKTDMRKVRSRKQDMIDREVELHLGAYKSSGAEGEAQRNGIPARVAKLLMRNVLRTEATDETQGFMKVAVSANDDRILGFTMIGSDAGEVMAAIQAAMLAELPYPKLRDAVITHLTIAEGFGPLFGNVPPRAA
jgi:pyruvate/2-oxoglutarate dehydrogenase complex dihydrolipoamide dehydrogenase (E3) component